MIRRLKMAKDFLKQAKCDAQIADALIKLVVAAGNKAKVSEPLLKLPELNPIQRKSVNLIKGKLPDNTISLNREVS